MRFNISLTDDDILHYTENSVILDECYTAPTIDDLGGSKINEFVKDGICLNFTNKAIAMLKQLAKFKQFFTVKYITTVSGITFNYVTINNSIKELELFKSCSVLGINFTEFRIGIALKDNKYNIYLTNKILKDLNKLNNETVKQLLMFFVSLAMFCINCCTTDIPDMSYEPLAGSLSFKADKTTVEETLSNLMCTFKEGIQFEATEFVTEDFSSVVYFNNIYSRTKSVYKPTTWEYSLLTKNDLTDMSKVTPFLVLSTCASSTISKVMRLRVFDNCAISSWDLNILDLDDDSIFSHLANLCDYNYIVSVDKNLKFKEGSKYNHLEPSDLEVIHTVTLKRLVDELESIGVEESNTISNLVKEYNIKIDNADDITGLSSEYDHDDYAKILYSNVESYYDDFNLKKLKPLIKSVIKGDTYSLLFTGPSGSGKSTAAAVMAYKCGLPYVSVNFTTNIEESDFIGTMVANTNRKTPTDPPFVWQDGLLTKCVRSGYAIGCQEFNMARPGILSKFNSLLDEHKQLELPTGEIVKAHKNFRIFATCNIGAVYEGTNRFNKALINRFNIVQNFEEPSKDEIIEIITSRLGYKDKTKIEKVLNVYYAIKKYAKEQGIDVIISLRQLLDLFKQGKYFKNAEDAVEMILLNNAFLEEPEYYLDFKSTVLTAFDLKFKI